MRRHRQRRGRPPTKRLDMSVLRDLVRDERLWTGMGVVKDVDGGAHFELVTEGGVVVDVMVEVELKPSGRPLFCRLGAGVGGAGVGLWAVPREGTEVIVAIPEGDDTFMPTIVTCLSTNRVPAGLAVDTYVLAVPPGGQLLIHDGNAGEALALATKADVEGHTHGPGTFVAPSGGGAVTGSSGASSSIGGTSVLKAK